MEFYASVGVPVGAADLHRLVRIAALPELCASIDKVLSNDGERGEIFCVWGQYHVRRELLRDGVRFTVPGCPNALQWTITADGRSGRDRLVVHCTINRTEHDADFVESLRQFVADWQAGLASRLPALREKAAPKGSVDAMPWYG
jgi:hypothetical protein